MADSTETPKSKAKRKGSRSKPARVITNPETGDKVKIVPYEEYPDVFKYMAKVMFISGTHNIAEISRKMNIPANTLRSWQTRENWTALKREVNRLAAQDAVRESRRAMSNYIVDIDRGANKMLQDMQERIKNMDASKLIGTESEAARFILELWKIKLQIVRILNYGTESRGFTPHPADLQFDGTSNKKSPKALTANSAEIILENIPKYLREAANFVLGMDEEELDPALLDAVAKHIDEKLKSELQTVEDDNILF